MTLLAPAAAGVGGVASFSEEDSKGAMGLSKTPGRPLATLNQRAAPGKSAKIRFF
jgi:hypothetical protein